MKALICIVVLFVVAWLVLGCLLFGCRSAVNVNVKNDHYECQYHVVNSDGTITFEECVKDGTGDNTQESEGGPGDETLEGLKKILEKPNEMSCLLN